MIFSYLNIKKAHLTKLFILTFFLLAVVIIDARAKEVFFATTPTINPDATQIVFSYEGDLWIISANGGTAYRLTGMEGEETNPRFSPDGKWIAFSASQEGNSNVYVMPTNGGEILQLTFHAASDKVESWSWDSQYIYFTSNRSNSFTTYKIKRTGGTPERLFHHYYINLHSLIEHPITHAYYFSETHESLTFAYRKGYKGDYNPDIKSYDPKTKEFKLHTSYKGKDFWHTIDAHGNIYFVSDRFNGEYNLYKLGDKDHIRLTEFETSIKKPQVSANGEKIVFEKDYQLFVYTPKDKKTEKIQIDLFSNNTLKIDQDFNVNGKISYFDVSPDNKKFAFVSRGELFLSDTKGKFIRQLKTGPGRILEVKWLKDNKTLLFTQTVKGWINLFKIEADKGKNQVQLTFDEANNRNIHLNSHMSQALYLSGASHLNIIDLSTFKSKTVITDEFWAYDNIHPYFSPDGKYIVFTAYRNFEEDIFIHRLDSGKTFNLTTSGISEAQPFWSPDGKYIYFVSNRYKPYYPRGEKDSKIYRFPFHKYSRPFKSDEFDKLFAEDSPQKNDSSKRGNEKNSIMKNAGQKPLISINAAELPKYWEQISPNAGTQGIPYVTEEKGEINVLYLSNHDGQNFNIWKTRIKPFESNKTEKIKGAVAYDLLISSALDHYYTLVNGKIGSLNLKGNEFKAISITYTFQRNLQEEFTQMFYELWAGMEENFYDENFHGKDWRKIKAKYQQYLPYIHSRKNLRNLIDDMMGELNSSHLGFRSRGAEEKTFHSMKTMEIGLIFEDKQPYTVKKIVIDSPADKKEIDVRPGDRLIAINGKKIDQSINREYYFTAPTMAEELSLTFLREQKKDKSQFIAKFHPVSNRSLKRNLYDQWIRDNQQVVDEKSDKRIAYIHMKDMRSGELKNFLIEMTTEWYNRDALILDLRYNRGGNVHDAVLNFLSQRPYTLWKYREGKFTPQPNFAPAAKPIVLLINEQSLSDAELTSAGFKELNLGKIIGTESYRWLIFTSEKALVDGSIYRLPSWGCYTLDKKDIEWNGVKPDIYIKTTFKDKVNGEDPQLNTAIKEIMKQLK